jgi:hypothetical protein
LRRCLADLLKAPEKRTLMRKQKKISTALHLRLRALGKDETVTQLLTPSLFVCFWRVFFTGVFIFV